LLGIKRAIRSPVQERKNRLTGLAEQAVAQ
jgi:hypothetical protein